ncbi:MAG: FG-GAP repeat domain-containing protein [Bryobacteraceae bacterium]
MPRFQFRLSSVLLCSICVLGSGAAGLQGAIPIYFDAPPTFLTGGPVTAVATGDFTRNGALDLAAISIDANTVSIFRGVGDGTFRAGPVYTLPNQPAAIAVGDFNHDGRLDLAITCSDGNAGTLSILLGDGDGLFQRAVNYPLGRQPATIAIGDFNHDGNPDLAIIDVSGAERVYIMLGERDGTFKAGATYGTGFYPSDIVTADFNGDGNLDLAVADGGYDRDGQGVTIILGKGDGTFERPTEIQAGNSPAGLAVADFNGDGKLDLAVTDFDQPGTGPYNAMSILLGNGDGTFQKPATIYVPGPNPDYVAAVDFNNDGLADLVVSTGKGVALLLGKGDGSFETPVSLTGIEGDFALGDFNGDGQLDLAMASGGLTVLVQQSDGGFPHDTNIYAGSSLYSIAAADFNGDGLADLVAADLNSPSVGVLLGNGDGTFQPATYYGAPKGASVWVADVNGDGKPDLLVCGSAVEVRLGNGQGQFGPALVVPVARGGCALGDFNLDGKLDLAVGTASGLAILLGNGNGTFQSPMVVPGVTDTGALAVGDFNGDGKPDIAAAMVHAASVSILFGNGDGTFQSPAGYGVGDYPYSLAVAHFTDSGRDDLAVANYGNPFAYGSVSVLLNKGDGTFWPAVDYGVGAGPYFVAAGRFTSGGWTDIVLANAWSNAISILAGNGDGTFQPPAAFSVPAQPYGLAIGDFNGDGNNDLAVADRYGVSLLMNTTR